MIRLELFTEKDTNRLMQWFDSEKSVYEWGGPMFAFPPKYRHMQRHLIMNPVGIPKNLAFKALSETGSVIGHGEIFNINYQHNSATLCRILIGPKELRGKGRGRELIDALLSVCFNTLGLHRVDLKVYAHNAGAVRCYEKAGFKKEGLMRDVLYMDGVYWDCHIMSILENEWAGRDSNTKAG